MNMLKNYLTTTTLSDVFPHNQGVISFDHDALVGQVLEVLGCYKVLSAPVVVRPDSQPPRVPIPDPQQVTPVKAILGFVGVGDILEELLQGVADEGVFELTADSLERLGARVCAKPVFSLFGPETHGSSLEVLGWSDSCRDWGLKGNLHESFISVIRNGFLHAQQVTSPSQRRLHMRVVHRLAVFDCTEAQGVTTPHLKGIFSQADVIRLIASQPDLVGPLGKRTLKDLHLVQGQVVLDAAGSHTTSPLSVVYPHGLDSPGGALHRVVCVQEGTPAIEAFQVMYREKVSGIGIVAQDGRLVGNLSASDLRCLAPGLFTALLLPVGQFLGKRPLLENVQQEAAQALNGTSTGVHQADEMQSTSSGQEALTTQHPPLVTCLPVSTFSQVLSLLAKHRLHRVYVVDPDQKPVGVVTLTDVLRTLSDVCE